MRSSANHPLSARFYPRVRAFADVRGRVPEIGAGHRANFPCHPAAADSLITLEPEPEPRLRAVASQAAVVGARAEHLPVHHSSFDAVIASFMLCSLPDVPRALSA